MKPLPLGHGSVPPAHGYCERPPRCCPGCSGSQVNFEIRTFPPTGTAPLPLSLYACSEVSMQKFVRPTSAGRTLGSFGQASRRSYHATATAPFGPAATDGWNWSVAEPDRSTLSLTTTGVVQVTPPSVDWVNFTSMSPRSAFQSSQAR